MCKITLHNSQRDLPLSISELRKAVSFLIKALNVTTDQVIFHFVSETKISRLHKDFFNDASPTDCITFPIDAPQQKKAFHLLGEAFICPKVAKEYAKRHALQASEELLRYIVHCLLHLLGYDDIDKEERKKMKRKEDLYLKKILAAGFASKILKSF